VVSISLAGAAPRDFASAMSVDTATDLVYNEGYDAMWTLWDVLYDIAGSGVDNAEELARASIQQFADYVAPMVAGNTMPAKTERVTLPKEWSPEAVQLFRASLAKALEVGGGRPFTLDGLERGDAPAQPAVAAPTEDALAEPVADPAIGNSNVLTIDRFESAIAEITGKFSRFDEVNAAIVRIDGLAATVEANTAQFDGLIERIAKLENQPVPLLAPVRFADAVKPIDRLFAANTEANDPNAVNRAALQAEYERLESDLPNEPNAQKRMEGATRLNLLKVQLSQTH